MFTNMARWRPLALTMRITLRHVVTLLEFTCGQWKSYFHKLSVLVDGYKLIELLDVMDGVWVFIRHNDSCWKFMIMCSFILISFQIFSHLRWKLTLSRALHIHWANQWSLMFPGNRVSFVFLCWLSHKTTGPDEHHQNMHLFKDTNWKQETGKIHVVYWKTKPSILTCCDYSLHWMKTLGRDASLKKKKKYL